MFQKGKINGGNCTNRTNRTNWMVLSEIKEKQTNEGFNEGLQRRSVLLNEYSLSDWRRGWGWAGRWWRRRRRGEEATTCIQSSIRRIHDYMFDLVTLWMSWLVQKMTIPWTINAGIGWSGGKDGLLRWLGVDGWPRIRSTILPTVPMNSLCCMTVEPVVTRVSRITLNCCEKRTEPNRTPDRRERRESVSVSVSERVSEGVRQSEGVKNAAAEKEERKSGRRSISRSHLFSSFLPFPPFDSSSSFTTTSSSIPRIILSHFFLLSFLPSLYFLSSPPFKEFLAYYPTSSLSLFRSFNRSFTHQTFVLFHPGSCGWSSGSESSKWMLKGGEGRK